jgi:outer membrane protein assembly factor BamB
MQRDSNDVVPDPGHDRLLEEVQRDLDAGRHVALVGPVGAGKSTLLARLATSSWGSARNVLFRDRIRHESSGLWLAREHAIPAPSGGPERLAAALAHFVARGRPLLLSDGEPFLPDRPTPFGDWLWWTAAVLEATTVVFACSPSEWAASRRTWDALQERHGLRDLPTVRVIPSLTAASGREVLLRAAARRRRAAGSAVEVGAEAAAALAPFGVGRPFYLEALGRAAADAAERGHAPGPRDAAALYEEHVLFGLALWFEARHTEWIENIPYDARIEAQARLTRALDALGAVGDASALSDEQRAPLEELEVVVGDWIDQPFVDWHGRYPPEPDPEKRKKRKALKRKPPSNVALVHALRVDDPVTSRAHRIPREVVSPRAPRLLWCGLEYGNHVGDVVAKDGFVYRCGGRDAAAYDLAFGHCTWTVETWETYHDPAAKLIVTDDLVIYKTREQVRGIDRRLGFVRYTKKVLEPRVAVAGGWLWVGAKELKAYDLATGAARRKYTAPSIAGANDLVSAHGSLYVATQERLYKLDLDEEGARVAWETVLPWACHIIPLDGALLCLCRWSIARVDARSGAPDWDVGDLNEPAPGLGLFDDTVVISDGGVFGKRLLALDLSTGEVRWSSPLGALYGLGATHDRVVCTDQSSIFGIDPQTGERSWEVEHPALHTFTVPLFGGHPFVYGEHLFVEGHRHLQAWCL